MTTTADNTRGNVISQAAAVACDAPCSPQRFPAAFRWNKTLVALYVRLTASGKTHKVALIACARKLLVYANTVVQRGTPWTEKVAMF